MKTINNGNQVNNTKKISLFFPEHGEIEIKETILEGTLEKILSIEAKTLFASNGVFGPGYNSWSTGQVYTTKFLMKENNAQKSMHTYYYQGIILPDSLGHLIKVHIRPGERIFASKIHDLDIDRLYS